MKYKKESNVAQLARFYLLKKWKDLKSHLLNQ